MQPSAIPARGPHALDLRGSRFERWSWYFSRISGLLLIVLALGHVLIMHIVNQVDVIDFQFIVDRWRSWGWRLYDWLLLVLAVSHGANGLRLAIDDYVHARPWRTLSLGAAAALYLVLMVVGTVTIVSFRG